MTSRDMDIVNDADNICTDENKYFPDDCPPPGKLRNAVEIIADDFNIDFPCGSVDYNFFCYKKFLLMYYDSFVRKYPET